MAERVRAPGWLIALLMLIGSGISSAHDLGLARVVVTPLDDDSVELAASLPAKLRADLPLVPDACSIREGAPRSSTRLTRTLSWRIECDRPLVALADPIVLDWQREAVLLGVDGQGGFANARLVAAVDGRILLDADSLVRTATSGFELAARYTRLGIEHILKGIDHLAFVAALCLLASGWQLVRLITAFTIGHSVTLGLASLGLINLPMLPVEALIALSVAFLAREAMLGGRGAQRHGFRLVVAFGMLHGLGFASALRELGAGADGLLLSLFSFNVGVEIGQLLFVTLVLGAVAGLRRVADVAFDRLRPATAFGVGSMAMLWTFERVSAFL
jgi:hypothetical protein